MADTISLHHEMFEAIAARDFQRLRELAHPDYRYSSADGQAGGIEVGIANTQTYTNAFPDLVFEIVNSFSSGEWSCIEYVGRGTHTAELQGIPATGKRVQGVACNVIQVRDGKVYREHDYFDTMTVLQQLGVAPTG